MNTDGHGGRGGISTGALMNDPGKIAVALLEDDVLFRRYVAGVLENSGRYRVSAEAGSVAEAAAWPAGAAPAVVLADVAMPGAPGTSAVAGLLARFPGVVVVMLTARDEEGVIMEAIRAGAGGYVLKGTDSAGLVAVLDDVRAGGAPMSPAIARKVLALMREPVPAAVAGWTGAAASERKGAGVGAGGAVVEGLTPREGEVLALVAAGAVDKEVAAKLGISLSVVKAHLGKIYAKWRVRSRTEAAIKFSRLKKG